MQTTLRIVALVGTLSTLTLSGSLGAELKRLDSVLMEEQSDAIYSYVFKRCSALYLTIGALVSTEADLEQEAQQAQDLSTRFFQLTLLHADQANLPADAEVVIQTIIEISGLYTDEMKENFLATGNRFDESIQADTQVCRGILDLGD